MQKYVYTLCFLSGTPLIFGAGSVITISELENIQKSGNKSEDIIVLRDGSTLAGTLKGIPQLVYSFGNIPVNVNDVAVVAFSQNSENSKIQIITSDGLSYIADLPIENFIVIQYLPNKKNPKYTMSKELSPSSIRYITLKEKNKIYSSPKKAIFDIELKNGDHIPATIASDSITLSNGLQEEKIKTMELFNLEVNFGIHGFTKNKKGLTTEFDFTYVKEKILPLQLLHSQQALGLPWSSINKIERVESQNETVAGQMENSVVEETTIKAANLIQESRPLVISSTDLGSYVEKKPERTMEVNKEIAPSNSLKESNGNLQATDRKSIELSSKFKQEMESLLSILSEKNLKVQKLEKELDLARAEILDLQNKSNDKTESRSLDTLIAELQTEKQNSLELQKNLEELRTRYQNAEQQAQKFQSEIQGLIASRENLQREYDSISDKLAQEKKHTNLKVEAAKSKALAQQLNNIQARLKRNDEAAHQLMDKFEDEIISLQLLLSGKQREVQFSEKELQKTLKEIALWKNAKGEDLLANFPKQNLPLEEDELLHPIHFLSDIDQLTLALGKERNNTKALQRNLDEALEGYKNEQLRAKSLHEEFKRQASANDNLKNKDVSHQDEFKNEIAILQKSLEEAKMQFAEAEQKRFIEADAATLHAAALGVALENRINELQFALEQGQRQLQDKDETIKALSLVKQDLIDSLNSKLSRSELKNNHEHQLHLIADIDQLSLALERERQNALILQESLGELNACYKVNQPNFKEHHYLSREAMEDNLHSELEALDSLVHEKQQRIHQLESELYFTINSYEAKHNELEESVANMMHIFELEKIHSAEKEIKLQNAEEKQLRTSRFAAAMENQVHALSQKTASFGNEFALTQKKLNETQRDFHALLEVNEYLHHQVAEAEDKSENEIQRNQQLQKFVVDLTHLGKELDLQLAEKSREIEELHANHLAEKQIWVENRSADHQDNDKNIQKLLTAIDVEKQRALHLENELDKLSRNNDLSNKEIENLTAAVQSERDLTSQLGIQLQRVHKTETNYKNQIDQQAEKLAFADEMIKTLTSENQAFQNELIVRQEQINKLEQAVNSLQEMADLVKTYENEIIQAKNEHQHLAGQLLNEKQDGADKDVLIERLSEIVKIQKNALERIENSQIALRE